MLTAEIPAEDLSDRDVLLALITKLDRIEASLSAIEVVQQAQSKQMDHIDEMFHTLQRFVDENSVLLDRAKALIDPGKPVRALLAGRRGRG